MIHKSLLLFETFTHSPLNHMLHAIHHCVTIQSFANATWVRLLTSMACLFFTPFPFFTNFQLKFAFFLSELIHFDFHQMTHHLLFLWLVFSSLSFPCSQIPKLKFAFFFSRSSFVSIVNCSHKEYFLAVPASVRLRRFCLNWRMHLCTLTGCFGLGPCCLTLLARRMSTMALKLNRCTSQ